MADRLQEMEALTLAIEQGSLSAAARQLDLSPSAVSRMIDRLEQRLGVRLLIRSTRHVVPTPEGNRFYRRARHILAALDAAEAEAADKNEPCGRLRITTSAVTATYLLAPLLPRFLTAKPRVAIDLVVTDDVVDLVEMRIDVALRFGALGDSSLRSRRLTTARRVLVAAPDYLERRGTPQTMDDLSDHDLLSFSYARSVDPWPLAGKVQADQRVIVDDGAVLLSLAMAGLGIARVVDFQARGAVAAGALEILPLDLPLDENEPLHAVWIGRDHLPSRLRAFLDFLVAELGGSIVASLR